MSAGIEAARIDGERDNPEWLPTAREVATCLQADSITVGSDDPWTVALILEESYWTDGADLDMPAPPDWLAAEDEGAWRESIRNILARSLGAES